MAHTNTCSVEISKDLFQLQVSFEIPAKGVLGIFGHSGSGKTTLLRCLAGLEKKVKGQILFNDQIWLDKRKSISPQLRNIGYIFQDSRLFPHMTVLQNLEYGMKRSGSLHESSQQSLFQLLNIGGLLERMPDSLSGGEKQRVAIARALLKKPQMLLMDEPMASLDQAHKNEILPYLERLHDRLSIPIVYVSHSLDEMSRLCDRILVLKSGRVIFNDEITKALSSAESPLLKTKSAVVVLNAKVSHVDLEFGLSAVITDSGTLLQVKGTHRKGRRLRLRVSAADISLCKSKPADSSILNILPAKLLAVVEETHSEVLLQLAVNDDILLARISKKSFKLLELKFDMDVFVQIKGIILQSDVS
ncbi:MAG: molybdenum ABC transporter ATP-binding protein [Gammaproteobacteria bacterium]|nr:molybdenum ABC transporter ATP-binding protein [Gammaproteobacteria bacterium]